jgi:hypothetical protein
MAFVTVGDAPGVEGADPHNEKAANSSSGAFSRARAGRDDEIREQHGRQELCRPTVNRARGL